MDANINNYTNLAIPDYEPVSGNSIQIDPPCQPSLQDRRDSKMQAKQQEVRYLCFIPNIDNSKSADFSRRSSQTLVLHWES